MLIDKHVECPAQRHGRASLGMARGKYPRGMCWSASPNSALFTRLQSFLRPVMITALPFDIVTQIASYSDRNTLLALRGVCIEIREFATPLAFKNLRVSCTNDGFQQLHDMATNCPDLTKMVQSLLIDQTAAWDFPGECLCAPVL